MENNKNNKISSFSFRFIAMLIDLAIILSIMIPLSLVIIINQNGTFIINGTFYYLWFLIFILLILFFYILVPIMYKTKTLGMALMKIKTISLEDDSNTKIVLKRSTLTVLMWIIILITFIAFVPPTSAYKLMTLKSEEEIMKNFTILELCGISIPATFSPLVLFSNLFFYISISINKNSIGIIDKLYNIRTIYLNRFENNAQNILKPPSPIPAEKIEIEWKD
ncbi:MAG: RDD family protein [Metamycoplasmataceae bacterium]